MSKAGLTLALFVFIIMQIGGLLVLPNVLGRQHALELCQARREIADFQVRDGQLERAQDSLNRALNLNFSEELLPRSEAEETASLRLNVETLAQMGLARIFHPDS